MLLVRIENLRNSVVVGPAEVKFFMEWDGTANEKTWTPQRELLMLMMVMMIITTIIITIVFNAIVIIILFSEKYRL